MLTYASEILGNTTLNDNENVQIKFCRYLSGVGPRTPNVIVLGECGRYPLFISYSKCFKFGLNY